MEEELIMPTYKCLALSTLFTLLTSVSTSASEDYSPTHTPSDTLLSADDISAMLNDTEFHALLVFKNNALIVEHYQSGQDEDWGLPLGNIHFDRQTLHDLRSATKSVVSLLIGIAIEEGYISGLDASIGELLDNKAWHAINLHHVLTMTAGTRWHEQTPYTDPSNDEMQMYQAQSAYQYVLGKPFDHKAGDSFNYSGGMTQLLVEILEKQTEKPIKDYAKEKLFTPLGIKNYQWKQHASGQAWGASGLRMNAMDFSKIGRLYLQNGQWNNQKIVPQSWVKSTFATTVKTGLPIDIDYGLHWWIPNYQYKKDTVKALMAQGNGGQYLLLLPEHDLLIVTFGGYYNRFMDMSINFQRLVLKGILPALGLNNVMLPLVQAAREPIAYAHQNQ